MFGKVRLEIKQKMKMVMVMVMVMVNSKEPKLDSYSPKIIERNLYSLIQ